jgi:alpha-L-rhamnosidase
MLRKIFELDQPVNVARAYVTAMGVYELRINGQRVGDNILAPEWTSYSNRVQYQTYDVTALLRRGTNVLAAFVGEGWYAGRLMVVGRNAYGPFPKFLMQLDAELQDNSHALVVTDDSWRSTIDGPIRAAGIYDGETFDDRRSQPDWDRPDFDDHLWGSVKSFPLDSRRLAWQRNEPIRVEQELACRKLSEPSPGHYVFDFGQNMVGWCRLKAQGIHGKTVVIRHAEALNEDGTIYTANLRGAPQLDYFTPRADGQFSFEPHFTYHGFRYIEVTGLGAPPEQDAAVGRVFHSATPLAGNFECSDPSLNQLMHNVVWTERANLMSSPNDCPQRDERFGWMGDIQAFAQTAMFNMDLAAFCTKFAQDTRDDQADDGRFPDFAPHPGDPNGQFSGAPAWADAGVFVPWCAYINYDDPKLLADQFEAARRWVEHVHRLNPELIWTHGRNNDYNDWLNGDWIKQQNWPQQGGSVPNELLATAFFAHSTELVAKMAERLGYTEKALSYRALFNRVKAAFNERFVRDDGLLTGGTQAGYALALHFDLLPETIRPKAVEHLVAAIHHYQDHLSTGIQTTHRAMLELSRRGYDGLAWQLLTNRTFPSWLYMVDNGATTIWERWDGYVKGRGFQDPGMNSLNHWAFGSIGEWMWRNIIGLNPDEHHPGWKHFLIAPHPGGGVTWARSGFNSIRGRIESGWKVDGPKFALDVLVPVNTSATIMLPARDASEITESGKPFSQENGILLLQVRNGRAVIEVQSGRYHFASSLPAD